MFIFLMYNVVPPEFIKAETAAVLESGSVELRPSASAMSPTAVFGHELFRGASSLRESSICSGYPCGPAHQQCGAPFADAPSYHLMDQVGCAENDANGPGALRPAP